MQSTAAEKASPKSMKLVPDFGSQWGLWSSNPPIPPGPGGMLEPSNFGFNPSKH